MNCLKLMTLTFASALIATTAFAAQGVYGTWKFPDVNQGGLLMVSTVTIAANSVTGSATCSMNGQTATVSVTAPAIITATQIQVTGSATQNATGPVQCNVELTPSTLDYTVSPDDATLTVSSQGAALTLQRQ